MSQKVEETLNRINTHKGVKGVIVVDSGKDSDRKGFAIRSTMSQDDTIETGSLIINFQNKANDAIKKIFKDEEIVFIRIRSREHEIMIAPDKDFTMIVI